MADSSSFNANIITDAVDNTGETVIGVVQSNVIESSTVEANLVTGGRGDDGTDGVDGVHQLSELTDVDLENPLTNHVLQYNGTDWTNAPLLYGDMDSSVYDPQNVAGDAFARANHTGTQTLSTISDVTASAAELNTLDGVTASTTELNYTDGVTSNIQTQLNAKAADVSVVHVTGAETAAGVKTWSDDAKFSGNVGIGVSGTILDKQHISSGYTRYSDTYGVRFGSSGSVSVTGSQAANTLTLTATTTTASGEIRSTTAGTNSASVVTNAGAQTLTNKTLTSPIISTISNTGTITLPSATDTLVGRATTDTLTNKTISGASNTLSNIGMAALSATGTPNSTTFLRGDGVWATPAGSGDVSSNTATSVDSEIALFSSTTGKLIKRATGSG